VESERRQNNDVTATRFADPFYPLCWRGAIWNWPISKFIHLWKS